MKNFVRSNSRSIQSFSYIPYIKSIGLVISMILTCTCMYSQSWNKDYAQYWSFEDIVETDHSSYLALAYVDSNTHLVKLVDEGHIIGEKLIQRDQPVFYQINKTGKGDFFIPPLYSYPYNWNNQVYNTPLIKLDSEGEIVDVYELGQNIGSILASEGNQDGSLTLLERKYVVDSFIIHKISHQGNRLWKWGEKYVGHAGWAARIQGIGLHELSDEKILFHGYDHDLRGNGAVHINILSSDGQLLLRHQDSVNAIVKDPTLYHLNGAWVNAQAEFTLYFSRQENGIKEFEFVQMNTSGDVRNTKRVPTQFSNQILSTNQLDNETILILGNHSQLLIDKDYNLLWEKEYPDAIKSFQGSTRWSSGARPLQDVPGFIFCGNVSNPHQGFSYATRLDSMSRLSSGNLSGQVFLDQNFDCNQDQGDSLLNQRMVSAKHEDGRIFFQISDQQGGYELFLPFGNYQVTSSLPTPLYFENCEVAYSVQIDSNNLKAKQDLGSYITKECPLMHVKVLNSRMRICEENLFHLEYWNNGTAVAKNARIEVLLDPYLKMVSADAPYTSQSDRMHTFELGDVPIHHRGTIQFYALLDCDDVSLGQTHCVKAHIFPDSICERPSLEWDGSTVIVKGECINDSVHFTIENIGDDMSQPREYTILKDGTILHRNPFQLQSGASLRKVIEGSNSWLRLIAEQSANHPGSSNPSIGVSGCGSGSVSTKFANSFAEDDEDNFIDIFCAPNRGSYDPNDKQAFPIGFQEPHYIDKDRTLEYYVRFQNTGNDTAFFVLLRDSISENLDLSTLVINGSSHNYSVEIREGRVLTFIFDDILLPDSTTNLEASQGFVSFSIQPYEDLKEGTRITNEVDIFFDFNPPIRTNEVFHTIGLTPILTTVKKINSDKFSLSVYPNPVAQFGELNVAGNALMQNAHFQIISMEGKVLVNDHLQNGKTQLNSHIFTHGMYLIRVFDPNGGLKASEHFIIH